MSNRIAQWLDKSTVDGILDLSHHIIPEAAQGNYMISATTDKEEQIFHSFEIKEYGLLQLHLKRMTEIICFILRVFDVSFLSCSSIQFCQSMR